MKTYTLEQIQQYIESQDSLGGDVLYNLSNIDKYLIDDTTIHNIEDDEEFDQFITELDESYDGTKFRYYDGNTYEFQNLDKFIREYGTDGFYDINWSFDKLISSSLIIEIDE